MGKVGTQDLKWEHSVRQEGEHHETRVVTEVTAQGLMGKGLILKIHVFISKSMEVSIFGVSKISFKLLHQEPVSRGP